MDFFTNARTVRLRSHLDKYLYADEDEEKVRQSREGSSRNVKWEVEYVEGDNHVIRLKSCYGRYLTATNMNYPTGMIGKKVIQTVSNKVLDLSSINWEPIRDRYKVKFMISGGKYLRANGGPQPWRNTITHDVPNRTMTQEWIMWIVDVIDINKTGSFADSPSVAAAAASIPVAQTVSFTESSRTSSSISAASVQSSSRLSMYRSFADSVKSSPRLTSSSSSLELGCELLRNVKTIRLKSQHGKYLVADSNEESVSQDINGASSSKSKWTVELVQGGKLLHLKSCYGTRLSASNSRFITGLTGKKVLQTSLSRLEDSGIDWQPIKVEFQQQQKKQIIKLMTRDGNFLRANRGMPPYKNTVTHDTPVFNKTQNWVFWDVEILELQPQPVEISEEVMAPADHESNVHVQYEPKSEDDEEEIESVVESEEVLGLGSAADHESNVHVQYEQKSEDDEEEIEETESVVESEDSDHPLPLSEPDSPVKFHNPPKLKLQLSDESFVRKIYYQIDGEDEDDWNSFVFKGNTVEELTEKLREEMKLEDISVCLRSEIDDQLYPLRRHLPRSNAAMHVVVVHQASPKVRNSFTRRALR